MKRLLLAACGVAMAFGLAFSVRAQDDPKPKKEQPKPAAKTEAKDDEKDPKKDDKDGDEKPVTDVREKVSYGLGFSQGKQFAERFSQVGADIDQEILLKGLTDGLKGSKQKYTDEEIQAAFEVFTKSLQAVAEKKQAAEAKKMKEQGEANLKEGKAYLEKNAKKEGVTATKSGIQYEVLKSGKGKSPKKTDTVTTHYHGTLIDGTVFDSSVTRKRPASFRLDQVIKGWTEVLQLMKVGDKWRVTIPSDLAYGENPRPGGPIGPNSVLIFEIELISIDDPEDAGN